MRLSTTNRLWFFGALLALAMVFALAACADDDVVEPTQPPAPSPTAMTVAPSPTPTPVPPVAVVVTTNILADWVENIGGDGVEIFSMVPVGADPHTYQPGAQAVAKVADADLVLSVGLGLEEAWLHDLLENAARDEESIVEFGEVIDPLEFAETHIEDVEFLESLEHIVHEVEDGEITPEEGLAEIEELLEGMEHHDEGEEAEEPSAMVHEIVEKVEAGQMDAEEAIEEIEHLTAEGEEEHDDHGHGVHDPHFWFDPVRVKLVVDDIAARLAVLDPDRADSYRANASAYNAELDELHSWTEQQVEVVPEDRRLLVTSHDSLGYFAHLYHFEVVGVVFGITTDVEPSAEDLAELIHEVEELGVPAVFGETTVSERLANSVAKESGAELVRLYSGSLGLEGSGAETYLGMVRTNVERIVEALK